MSERKRGRLPGFTMSEEHRLKIAKSNTLSYLLKHVEGERDMSATQVTAAIALLKKFVPDLQAVDGAMNVVTMTHEEAIGDLE